MTQRERPKGDTITAYAKQNAQLIKQLSMTQAQLRASRDTNVELQRQVLELQTRLKEAELQPKTNNSTLLVDIVKERMPAVELMAQHLLDLSRLLQHAAATEPEIQER